MSSLPEQSHFIRSPPPFAPSQILDAVRTRHADDLRTFQQRLIAKHTTPRHSSEYLNLRRIQETLAKQRNYEAAAKIREKADQMMAWEEEKFTATRQAEMLRREAAFKVKLTAEVETLKSRVTGGRSDQNRMRQVELERLLQRYSNVRTETEAAHRVEEQRLVVRAPIFCHTLTPHS